jgi:tetratricopeptide (TPR) repeat protein/succinate dehydrogenase hydrophobic anchor subunit
MHTLDNAILLFVFAHIASVIFSSPNKWQALLNPSVGSVTVVSLAVLYYYLSRNWKKKVDAYFDIALNTSAFILFIISLLYVFINAANLNVPVSFAFLRSQSFSPAGSQLDLLLFFIFILLYNGARTIIKDEHHKRNEAGYTVNWIGLVLGFIGTVVVAVAIFKLSNNLADLLLPPLRLSWYAGVEVLKQPITALFGIGVDNYPAIFTRVKDTLYNTTKLWQVSSFSVARNVPLHILAETGLLGFVSYILLFFTGIRMIWDHKDIQPFGKAALVAILLLSLVFPPSLLLYFVLFVTFGLISTLDKHHDEAQTSDYDVSGFIPVYIGLALVGFVIVGISGYWLAQTYAAEYHYRIAILGLNGFNKSNPYEELRTAINTNNRIEKYHIDFSRVNMLVANNVAQKKKEDIKEADRQTIAQAIQASIAEAKAAVALNPQKSTNWENLAAIYRNIINVAQGADAWTISAYQRAIIADPQNPSYRLNLGGVFYSLGNYQEALNLFQQSVALKPDWSNAYYNLAWAAYQKQDYQTAAIAMDNVLKLLDPKKDKQDYDKAKKDLEEFKKKLPKEGEQSTPSADSKLQLPSQAKTATLEPKLKLPKNAEPQITLSPSPTHAPTAAPTAAESPTPTP